MTDTEKILLQFTYLLAAMAFRAAFRDHEDEARKIQERLLETARESLMQKLQCEIEQARVAHDTGIVEDLGFYKFPIYAVPDFDKALDDRVREFEAALDKAVVLLRESLGALWIQE